MSNKNKNQKSSKAKYLIIVVIILIIAAVAGFIILKPNGEVDNNELNSGNAKIKFSEMYEKINDGKEISSIYKSYSGEKVIINGYMAVQSPLDESFIYLVGQPYVSCPFCAIGDVTKLEVIQVLMANGEKIKYTENRSNNLWHVGNWRES